MCSRGRALRSWWKCSISAPVGECGRRVGLLDAGGAVDVHGSGDLVGMVGTDVLRRSSGRLCGRSTEVYPAAMNFPAVLVRREFVPSATLTGDDEPRDPPDEGMWQAECGRVGSQQGSCAGGLRLRTPPPAAQELCALRPSPRPHGRHPISGHASVVPEPVRCRRVGSRGCRRRRQVRSASTCSSGWRPCEVRCPSSRRRPPARWNHPGGCSPRSVWTG